jgi:hypothetical protein
MPARKIPLNYRNITGYVQSDKSNDYTHFESSLERDALILTEFDKHILSFKTQPKKFYYDLNGKQHHYTPDIFVAYKDGMNLYVEVKYRADLKKDWPTLKPKFKAIIHSLKSEPNTRFKIWTEAEIRTPYLKNVTFLLPYKKRPVEEYQVKTICKILYRMDSLTPNELLPLCSKDFITQAEFINSLWYCIANNLVKTDLFKPMTMDSPIWVNKPVITTNVIEILDRE